MAAPASTLRPLRVRAVRAEQVGAGGGRPPPLSRLRPFRTPAPRAGARLAGGAQSVWRTRRPHESPGGHTHPPESPGGHRRLPDAENRGGRRAWWTLRRPHASCSAAGAGRGAGTRVTGRTPPGVRGTRRPRRIACPAPGRCAPPTRRVFSPASLLSRPLGRRATGPDSWAQCLTAGRGERGATPFREVGEPRGGPDLPCAPAGTPPHSRVTRRPMTSLGYEWRHPTSPEFLWVEDQLRRGGG